MVEVQKYSLITVNGYSCDHYLLEDSRDLGGLYGGQGNNATGAQPSTWELPAVSVKILKSQRLCRKNPPCLFLHLNRIAAKIAANVAWLASDPCNVLIQF